MDVISQGRERPPRRARRPRRPGASPPRRVPVVVGAVAAVAAAALVVTGHAPGRGTHRATSPVPRPAAAPPASYGPGGSAAAGRRVAGQAAGREAAALLRRPTHFTLLRPGQACPVSPGRPLAAAGGVVVGDGPVRALLRTGGNGAARLASTTVRGWYTLDVVWLNRDAYQGPYVIHTGRLDVTSPVALGVMAVSSGSGDTGQVPGFGAVSLDTWVRGPGCYAWQVDGVGFSHVIVVDAKAAPRPDGRGTGADEGS